MFDSQCDWAALVYEKDQDRDQILPELASDPHGDSMCITALHGMSKFFLAIFAVALGTLIGLFAFDRIAGRRDQLLLALFHLKAGGDRLP